MTEPWLEPKQYDGSDDCAICLERFDAPTKKGRRQVVMKLECGHIFHNDCMHMLCSTKRHPKCPLCRKKINEESICTSAYAFKKKAMDLNVFPRASYVRDVYYETNYPKQYHKSVRRGKNPYENRSRSHSKSSRSNSKSNRSRSHSNSNRSRSNSSRSSSSNSRSRSSHSRSHSSHSNRSRSNRSQM